MSHKDLEYLSKSAGVDLVAIKAKYQGQTSNANVQSTANMNDHSNNTSSSTRQLDMDKTNETLSKYSICNACQGLGIVKSTYNHMVMEKTCEKCDGESIIMNEFVNKQISELKQS